MITRGKNYEDMFALTGSGIDAFSETLETMLRDVQLERENRLRVRLSMEEALLRMRDRFGEDREVHAKVSLRRNRLEIRIDLEEDAYNPLSEEENELADLCGMLVKAAGLSPQYSYRGRTNTLRLQITTGEMNPVLKICIAILGGFLIGLAGKQLMRPEMRTLLTDTVMDPFYQLWSRILNVISGPVIFLAVVTVILNSSQISSRGGSSRRVIMRYFLLSFLMTGAALAAMIFIFPSDSTNAVFSRTEGRNFLQELLKIVPNDFVSPFLESNTPQLLLLAFVIGGALNALGTQVHNLTRIVRQAYLMGLQISEWISRLVPYAACVLIGFESWKGETSVLYSIWRCLLPAFLISCVCIAVLFFYIGRKEGLPVRLLLKKTAAPFFLTVKTGSLDASYGRAEQSCVSQLGIRRSFVTIALPNGLVLYMPVSSIGTIVFLMYLAMEFHVGTTPLWYAMAVILSVILFVATPPVPGANLLAYVTLFSQLGIPKAALITTMVFDIFFGIFANAANQLQLELVLQADRMGFLNRELLRRDLQKQA